MVALIFFIMIFSGEWWGMSAGVRIVCAWMAVHCRKQLLAHTRTFACARLAGVASFFISLPGEKQRFTFGGLYGDGDLSAAQG